MGMKVERVFSGAGNEMLAALMPHKHLSHLQDFGKRTLEFLELVMGISRPREGERGSDRVGRPLVNHKSSRYSCG